ncbi:SLAM family member 5-like [Podarcis muralis]
MDPLVVFLLLLCTFQAARMDDTGGVNFVEGFGESVTLPLEIPTQNISTLFLNWKSLSRKKALALWTPQHPLFVIDAEYSGRVNYSKENNVLQIRNLTLADGGPYEVVMGVVPHETILKNYTLFIFRINITKTWWEISSCTLFCELGAGKMANVTYNWTLTATGAPLSQSSRLDLVMSPTDAHQSYSCGAKALGVQVRRDISPYEDCGVKASGLFVVLCYWVAKIILTPVPLFLLYYHHFKKAKSAQYTVSKERTDVDYEVVHFEEANYEMDYVN